jgi:hypothetical protein
MAARAEIVPTEAARTGTLLPAETVGVVADGHKFANDGKVILLVRNSDGAAARVLTIQTPGTVDGQAIADRTVSVAFGTSRVIGPFPPSIYNQADGMVYLDYEAADVTDFNVLFLRIPQ